MESAKPLIDQLVVINYARLPNYIGKQMWEEGNDIGFAV